MSTDLDITSDLMKDEVIVWKGQPDPNKHFSNKDIFLVPFSLLWGAFAFFWEYMALTKFQINDGMNTFLPLWGIPFVLAGLYFIFGRFFLKYKSKLNTWYFVTNFRIIIYKNLFTKNVTSLSIATIPSININENRNGFGSLVFGNGSTIANIYGNTGLDFFATPNGGLSPAFYDLENVQRVYQLIQDTKYKT